MDLLAKGFLVRFKVVSKLWRLYFGEDVDNILCHTRIIVSTKNQYIIPYSLG